MEALAVTLTSLKERVQEVNKITVLLLQHIENIELQIDALKNKQYIHSFSFQEIEDNKETIVSNPVDQNNIIKDLIKECPGFEKYLEKNTLSSLFYNKDNIIYLYKIFLNKEAPEWFTKKYCKP
jgi:hypothetical protein